MSGWWSAWALPTITVIVAAAGGYISYLQHRAAGFERADRLLDYTTTGEVAQARHILGSEAAVRANVWIEPRWQGDPNDLTQALFRLAWSFDRIYAVRRSLRFGPRRLIDEVLGDSGHGCRYGRVAEALGALDPEEHQHLHRLTHRMGGRPCSLGDGDHAHSGGSANPTDI
jgi:hypothetical protein